MKARVLSLLGALGLLAGCATERPPDVTSYYDNVSGQRTDLLSDNLLKAPGKPREVVWLNASRIFRSPTRSDYHLEVNYQAKAETGYLDIPPGATLTLILDGFPMKFSGMGSGNLRKQFKVEGVEFVSEKAIYPVTRTALQQIAVAKQVKVQIRGNNGLIEREFAPENFEKFRSFVTRFAL